ncbi:MAG: hypothetical protein ACXAC5_04645 [Promethearchaeota archaeon]|jgi:hypothetical protein
METSDILGYAGGGEPLETFYVYRSLHSDESWGAVLADADIRKLPNIDFGMRVYAINEKGAIARARYLYEKIHAYDSDKENVRRFVAAALKTTSAHYIGKGPLSEVSDAQIRELSKIATKMAIMANEEYNNYFEQLQKEKESAESGQDPTDP